jgi:hypothetical protein
MCRRLLFIHVPPYGRKRDVGLQGKGRGGGRESASERKREKEREARRGMRGADVERENKLQIYHCVLDNHPRDDVRI